MTPDEIPEAVKKIVDEENGAAKEKKKAEEREREMVKLKVLLFIYISYLKFFYIYLFLLDLLQWRRQAVERAQELYSYRDGQGSSGSFRIDWQGRCWKLQATWILSLQWPSWRCKLPSPLSFGSGLLTIL